MQEAAEVKAATRPHEVLLVADALTGQDAVNTARAFDGVELLEGVDLLAGADELDRLAGDGAHRQGRAAAPSTRR
jgi:signal recognition particle GTPase